MHTSDVQGIGKFASIESKWVIPEIFAPPPQQSQNQKPNTTPGIGLCCGDDCSTRLSAGFWAWPNSTNLDHTAQPVFQLSPQYPQVPLPDQLDLGEAGSPA
jgi:hypothetical protein